MKKYFVLDNIQYPKDYPPCITYLHRKYCVKHLWTSITCFPLSNSVFVLRTLRYDRHHLHHLKGKTIQMIDLDEQQSASWEIDRYSPFKTLWLYITFCIIRFQVRKGPVNPPTWSSPGRACSSAAPSRQTSAPSSRSPSSASSTKRELVLH